MVKLLSIGKYTGGKVCMSCNFCKFCLKVPAQTVEQYSNFSDSQQQKLNNDHLLSNQESWKIESGQDSVVLH